MSIVVEAPGEHQAREAALKLQELVKDNPLLQMAIEGAGIRLSANDGPPIVHRPQRAG